MLDAGFLTLAQLKEAVLPDGLLEENTFDRRLQRLGKGVAGQINRHCGRVFQRGVNVKSDNTADRTSISLMRYPVEEVTRVDVVCKNDTLDITAEIETIGLTAGTVAFRRILGTYHDRVQVTYTGGYWLDDGTDMPEGATALEWDIQHAFEVQCQAVIEHRNLLGTASARTDEDSRPKIAELDLIDLVEKILKPYRRFG